MHEETHPEVQYEKSDVSSGGVLMFAIWFVAILAVIHVLLFGFLGTLERSQQSKQPEVPQVAQERPHFPKDIKEIPEPRLQVLEVRDMKELHEREDKDLSGYGWVDPAHGTVRIPLEQAMKLLSDPKTAEARGLVKRARKEEKK
jgi:hypothetical protein